MQCLFLGLSSHFSVLFLKIRLAKWIIQVAFSLPDIVEFIFYWEPSASVSTMKREIPLKSNFHTGTYPLLLKYFDLL